MTIDSKAWFALLVLLAAPVGCIVAGPAGDAAGVGGNGGAAGSGISSGGGGLAGTSHAGASGALQTGGGGSTTAGTDGAGGSGGSGLAGGAGSGGSGGGSGSGGASGALPSLGCGLPAAQPIGASGGRAGNGMDCKGKFARATVHDLNDPTNPFDTQGASKELDRVLAQNHCKTDVPPSMEAPAPCARYQGCDAGYPVIACRTQGKGHARQDALAMDAFWKLFSSL